MRSPIAQLGAIKLKLGALLGGAVVVTIVVLLGGTELGVPTWITGLVALALGLLAVDLLGTGLTAPLRQMARQADRLADGQPVDQVDDHANDEVGELARAFNRMAREVSHTDRIRRELVANVSHELRTPLASLTAVVENLVDGVEPAGPEQLRRMEAQVGRLSHLVGDLLDLSQLDAGATQLDRSLVDLRAMVTDVAYAAGPVAADRVQVRIPTDLAHVTVDPTRLRQVVVNLVDNALRHGPGDEPVTVTVTADAASGARRLTVEDTGPGIPREDAHRIFERFARSDAGRAADVGGAGLGLAIARWIVELHGGSITVDRPGEPGGRLTVELPMPDTTTPSSTGGPVTTDVTAGGGPATTAPPAPSSGGLALLPTPVAGLHRRGLAAVAVAAIAAALVPLEGRHGLGLALVMLVVAGTSVVALDRRPDRFGGACCAIAALVAAQWAVTDALWVLVPVTLGAVVLAGLGIWGPHRFGEAARALVVGPLLVVATPVALVRGLRSQRGAAIGRVLVPAASTLLVLLVFGGLLSDADLVFARLLDQVVPDVSLDGTLVLRAVLGVLAAAVVTTYVLVQRAGTVTTRPWERPVRPLADWLVPLAALVLLVGAFVLVQLGTLFGGDDRVQQTVGLTYAEYARTGFGQLLVVALLTLVVIGTVVRVADAAHRRLRDRLLGVLIGLTAVVLASAVHRLVLYTEAFGLSRLRISALAVLVWVAIVLALVVTAGVVHRFAPALPRILVVVTGVLALAFTIMRPDAIIARVNTAPAAQDAAVDTDYLTGLSADAAPFVIDRFPELAAALPCPDDDQLAAFNLARWQARVTCRPDVSRGARTGS